MERRDVLKLGASAAAVLAASPLLAALPPAKLGHPITANVDRISIPGVPNKNGRIYPREVWERVIEQEKIRLAARRLLVHSWAAPGITPHGWDRQIASVVGVATGITLANEVWVTWEVLQTEETRRWGAVIERGMYDMRASGHGSVRDGVVQADFAVESLVIMPEGMGA